ncbi:MAG: hypothetical protein RMI56_01915 [Sulfolobales archaeon]|nr:hypothetical protein [Sulfolobales archaeon]MDW8082533.1 hypothetical protein [Sulfolobales archaeon]
MGGWIVRCGSCRKERVIKVSYYLGDFKQLYHWCPFCRRNTHHEIVERIDP